MFSHKTKNFLPDYTLPTPQVLTHSRSLHGHHPHRHLNTQHATDPSRIIGQRFLVTYGHLQVKTLSVATTICDE